MIIESINANIQNNVLDFSSVLNAFLAFKYKTGTEGIKVLDCVRHLLYNCQDNI